MGRIIDARKVETYSRLDNFYAAWKAGDISRLAIIGRGGTGKSYGYQALDMPLYHRFVGRTTGIQIYTQVREAPHAPIVFDDIRQLLKDSACIDLLKQFGERAARRIIRWNTNAVPANQRTFVCTSNVLVVLNWVPKQDEDVAAILDRFDVLHFDPSKAEVIRRMRLFAECQKDVDLLANTPTMPSLRTLQKYEDWKKSKYIDEMEELVSECGVPEDVKIISQILAENPKAKVQAYAERTDRSYAAAKRDWSRKVKIARQLAEAIGV